MRLRNPEVRQLLLREVATLRAATGEIDEVVLGDAVEEVWHLLDPSVGSEPGDILLDDREVALSTELWRALERAPWPADSETRNTSSAWADVADGAAAFLGRAETR